MSGLFKFLGGLFSGILSFLGGIFGKRSNSGYYLEIADAKGTGNAAKAPKPAKAEPVAAQAEPAAVKSEAAPAAKAEPAAVQAEPAAAKAEVAPAAEAAPAQPEPAAVAKALNLPQPTVTNFSTTYLAPQATAPRRRPGANMSSFLNMARQVKTSS